MQKYELVKIAESADLPPLFVNWFEDSPVGALKELGKLYKMREEIIEALEKGGNKELVQKLNEIAKETLF